MGLRLKGILGTYVREKKGAFILALGRMFRVSQSPKHRAPETLQIVDLSPQKIKKCKREGCIPLSSLARAYRYNMCRNFEKYISNCMAVHVACRLLARKKLTEKSEPPG